jgi:hypothetical protein
MTMDDWVLAMQYVKDWCIGATKRLTKKTWKRSHAHKLMNAIGTIYPKYYKAPNAKATFLSDLVVLKAKCHPKPKWF